MDRIVATIAIAFMVAYAYLPLYSRRMFTNVPALFRDIRPMIGYVDRGTHRAQSFGELQLHIPLRIKRFRPDSEVVRTTLSAFRAPNTFNNAPETVAKLRRLRRMLREQGVPERSKKYWFDIAFHAMQVLAMYASTTLSTKARKKIVRDAAKKLPLTKSGREELVRSASESVNDFVRFASARGVRGPIGTAKNLHKLMLRTARVVHPNRGGTTANFQTLMRLYDAARRTRTPKARNAESRGLGNARRSTYEMKRTPANRNPLTNGVFEAVRVSANRDPLQSLTMPDLLRIHLSKHPSAMTSALSETDRAILERFRTEPKYLSAQMIKHKNLLARQAKEHQNMKSKKTVDIDNIAWNRSNP